MSFFGVTVEKIVYISKHPNADKLDIAKLEGLDFQFIVGKDQLKVGDKCLYFPIDAILPEDLQEKLGIKGKLKNNTVKTIKLRGEISQGVVGDLDLIKKVKLSGDKIKDSKKITKFLKVTKYSTDEDDQQSKNWFIRKFNYFSYCIKKLFLGKKVNSKGFREPNLPPNQYKYDIEGCDRNPSIIEYMLDKEVVITEKMEGTQISYTIWQNGTKVNQSACSRTFKRGGNDPYAVIAEESGLKEFAEKLHKHFHQDIIIYGEWCGPKIQKNIYKFEKSEIFIFDIVINQKFISFDLFVDLFRTYAPKTLKMVPVLYTGALKEFIGTNTLKKLSDGKSKVGNTAREGIVIKLKNEEVIENFGRSIIKQRGPEYLSKSEN